MGAFKVKMMLSIWALYCVVHVVSADNCWPVVKPQCAGGGGGRPQKIETTKRPTSVTRDPWTANITVGITDILTTKSWEGKNPVCLHKLPYVVGKECTKTWGVYYFNGVTKQCTSFVEQGCKLIGSNNFPNRIACLKNCNGFASGPIRTTAIPELTSEEPDGQQLYNKNPVCKEVHPHAVGSNCNKVLTMHYFSWLSKRCVVIKEIGCNVVGKNYFTSAAKCRKSCSGWINADLGEEEPIDGKLSNKSPICRQIKPVPVGSCKALIKVFFYDLEKKKCEEFKTEACMLVSSNQFKEQKDCTDLCSGW